MAHDHAHTSHDHKGDARAAFMGLIIGALALLALVYGIVKWTASRFEGHAAPPAAGAPPVQH
ncbi:MAG TPA: hypothetical protein VEB19_18200 [Gemmatimonadaceae bacterium]|nr:hypothetical protein [Gemmatimonadaceae bacterium]